MGLRLVERDTRGIGLKCRDGARVQRSLAPLGGSDGDGRLGRQQAIRVGEFRLSALANWNDHEFPRGRRCRVTKNHPVFLPESPKVLWDVRTKRMLLVAIWYRRELMRANET